MSGVGAGSRFNPPLRLKQQTDSESLTEYFLTPVSVYDKICVKGNGGIVMLYQRIQYFLRASETGSFSKAARQMYVSPQALSKQIGLLEEELGGRLFERSSQGIVLTSLGEYARQRFSKIDRDLTDAVEELQLRAGDKKERIHIGIFSALPQDSLVTPLVTFILGTLSNYQIGLDLLDLKEGKQLLLEGKIDLLLTNTHEEDDWGSCRCLSFGEHEARVIVSLLHPWAIKDSITEEDMRRETFLKMDAESDHYTVSPENSFYENIPCREVLRVTNFETLYALLQQGNAFAVFPLAFVNMDRAKIKSFPFPGRNFLFHTALIYNPDSRLKGLEQIVREIQEEFDLTEVSTGV